MNAFLIFCKRERGSVRRKYPFLENREVTRVLGEWWASLGTPDKAVYSALANQHKENRQVERNWYKGNMLTGKARKVPSNSQPAIIPGKLADESQLGGLSSLILAKEVAVPEERKLPLPVPLKKRYREGFYPSTQGPQPQPLVVEVSKEKTEQIVPTIDESEDERRLKMWRSHILEENNNVKDRRERACKGQRYREFMWTNYTTRRKTNRWELNQDKNERSTPPAKQLKTAKNENISFKISSSSLEEKADSSRESSAGSSLDDGPKKTKQKKTKGETKGDVGSKLTFDNVETSDNVSVTPDKKEESTSCDYLPLDTKTENLSVEANNNKTPTNSDKMEKTEDGVVTGSRKRKVRRQEIRRLTPGSTLNDLVA